MVEESQNVRSRRNRCQTVGEAAQQGYTIQISCKKCQHRRIVDAAPLWRLIRVRMWQDHFIALGRKIRCAKCRENYPEIRPSSEPADKLGTVGIASEADAIKAAQRMRG